MLALAPDYADFWWLSIGLGFVLLVVVITLLSLLASLVKDVARNAASLSAAVDAVTANTHTTGQLDEVADAAGRLRAEAESHAGPQAGEGKRR